MKRPIGVFDSGLGGLTVVRHLRRLLPGEAIVYFGDTARVPYGTKSPEAVVRFSLESCRFLLDRGVGAVVVACNTSSAVALDALRKECPVPVFDVVGPGARRAAEATRSGRIGVIGTRATIMSGVYPREIARRNPAAAVTGVPCPLFVPLAEEGWLDRPATVEIAREYLLPLRTADIDVLILGCTHYPALAGVIRLVMGDGVTLVDSGESCAAFVRERLASLRGGEGGIEYFVSDMPDRFREVGRVFMGEEIGEVAVARAEGGGAPPGRRS
ncbi:MAG: glutamate racemase [bacterium]|nr:glutamate racemase [bacterium]